MNRQRKVTDLFEAVEAISDPDAFQRVIDDETDDFVLADLRKQFWSGTGEKPWQVVEINRLLTRRKGVPAVADLKEGKQLAKPLSIKERIENNLAIFFLSTTIASFLMGFGVYQGALKMLDYTTISNERLRILESDLATKKEEITTLQTRVETAEASVGEQRWLRIRRVEGLDGSRARLVARVNGRAYSYPSRAVWSQLGPGMSTEDFPLPVDARAYDISFELLLLASGQKFMQFSSQQVISVTSWPFEADYKIFAVTTDSAGNTRGINIDPNADGVITQAVVAFEVR